MTTNNDKSCPLACRYRVQATHVLEDEAKQINYRISKRENITVDSSDIFSSNDQGVIKDMLLCSSHLKWQFLPTVT